VAELIEKKFGVHLGVSAVGELLTRLGLTSAEAVAARYQRDPRAIEKWQRETYPAIACRAKA
jgi:transposase